MDPRHPELAISRMRELMKQYDRVESDMKKATTSAQLGQLEREGGLVVQEICLVAPRLHEAMIQVSRQRRHDLARGILIEPQDTAVELPAEPVEQPVEQEAVSEMETTTPAEESSATSSKMEQVEPVKEEKPKQTTKKKTTKKAKK